jgi:hypothetical protein
MNPMKTALLAAMAGLTLCVVACEEKPAPSTPKPATPAPAKPATGAAPTGAAGALESVKEGASSAASTAGAAATELRDKAVAAFSSKYDDFKMQIATLQDKAKDVPAVAKGAFDSAMTQLNTLTKDVEAKLVELKSASGDTVKSLQDSIDGLWPKIQEQITAAQKLFPGG